MYSLYKYYEMFTLAVGGALAGECCDAYTSVFGTYNSDKWCSTYCCGSSSYLYCCSTSLVRASVLYRSPTCSADNSVYPSAISSWWVSNV